MFGADTGAALFPVPGQVVPVEHQRGQWEESSVGATLSGFRL